MKMSDCVSFVVFFAILIVDVGFSQSPASADSNKAGDGASRNFPSHMEYGDEGSLCAFNETTSGICRLVTSCPLVLSQLGNVKPIHCGFEGAEPVVCCPILDSGNAAITQNDEFPRLKVEDCGTLGVISSSFFYRKAFPAEINEVAGGVDAKPFAWPWMAILEIKDRKSNWTFQCGASIISKRYAITAALCFDGDLRRAGVKPKPENYALRMGFHDRRNTANSLQKYLDKIIVHQEYIAGKSYNDIALLHLKEDLAFTDAIRPVCLPDASLGGLSLNYVSATVTGWGDTTFGGFDSHILQEANVTIFNNSQCNENYQSVSRSAFPNGILDIQLCAGEPLGGKDACQGDSGGPLVYWSRAAWYQVGVVSFGYGCAFPGYPGIYTRVSSFLSWIDQNIDGPL